MNEPIAVDGEELGRLVDRDRRVLVDFRAGWCGLCPMMDGLIEEVAGLSGRDCFVVKVHPGTTAMSLKRKE